MNTNMFAVLLSDIHMAPNHTHWALKKSVFFLLRVRKRRASWCCGWKWRFISLTFDPWEMTGRKLGKCDSMSWQNDLRCTLFVYNRLDVIKTKNKNTLQMSLSPTDEPEGAASDFSPLESAVEHSV